MEAEGEEGSGAVIEPPKTRDEARGYKYNVWAGNPKGSKFNPARCAYEVHASGRSALFYQCSKRPGKGPDGLYCGTHAKRVVS